ncbi:MAG: flagellar basal body-associated FliL family protein, partial [Candidatus Manganitrophaceae bacterium]
MAEEAREKEKGQEGEAPKKKGLPVKWIAIGLIAVGIFAGGGFFFMKKGGGEKTAEAKQEEKHAAPSEHGGEKEGKKEGKKEGSAPGVIFDLDPFVVNLADARELRYLKVTIKLDLSKDETSLLTERMPQIRDALLILLSSKDYASIRTVEGKMELRDEILQRLDMVVGKGV